MENKKEWHGKAPSEEQYIIAMKELKQMGKNYIFDYGKVIEKPMDIEKLYRELKSKVTYSQLPIT